MARNKFPEVTVKRILDSAEHLFLQKGYDNTTIQDIVDDLGDLSKGAIYHHFKGKEEIMDAVTGRYYNIDFSNYLDTEKNGFLKLRKLAMFCMLETRQKEFFECAPNLMQNPKMLTGQYFSIFNEIAPMIQPYILEGIEDGSIKTDYPEELGELFLLLVNFWINPAILPTTGEKLKRKLNIVGEIMEQLGLPLMDEEVKNALLSFQSVGKKQ